LIGWLYVAVGAYWSVTTDLSKTHAGTLSGVMNMGANVGGVISPSLTPWLADHWGWTASLLVAALIASLRRRDVAEDRSDGGPEGVRRWCEFLTQRVTPM
jgi:MFS family permease